MKINATQIHDISQELQSGLQTYINTETYEIVFLVDPNDPYVDSPVWEEELEKIETEWAKYIVIKPMASWEAYKIMEDFVNEIENGALKISLLKALVRKRPFAHFKAIVETSEYRQMWFDFRDRKYEEYVVNQLKEEGLEIE